jgi:hypothetical protein
MVPGPVTELLNVAAAAKYLGIPEWKLRQLVKAGRIKIHSWQIRTPNGRGRPSMWFILSDLDKYPKDRLDSA